MHEDIIYFPKVNRDEPFQIQMCGKSYCDGTYKISRPDSAIYCVEYIYKGEGYVKVGDIEFHASAGDVYILPEGKNHFYYSDEKNPWEKIWFNIRGDFVANTLRSYGVEHVYHVKDIEMGSAFEEFVSCAERCMQEADVKAAYTMCAVEFLKIVQQIAKAPGLRKQMEPPSKVELLKQKIDGLTTFQQSFDELLEEFFYTKSYIIRAFKEAYGVTPYNYLLEHKMSTAKSLLRNTAMSINEMSNYLGFANAHYFSNFFSKRAGISPKEYRMSLVMQDKKE